MKILITGANGYIGKTLAKKLQVKHEVVGLTKESTDLTNAEDVKKFFDSHLDNPFDWVIHCATRGGSRLLKEDDSVIADNLRMYFNLLDNQRAYGRLISFGSGAEVFAANTPYGFSKKVIADTISKTESHFNIRIYGLFDENELPTRFIKANILRYINKEPIQIHSNKMMDFFYMEDLVSLIEYYLEAPEPPKLVSCSYIEMVDLRTIASRINRLSDYKVEVVVGDSESEDYSEREASYACNIIKTVGLLEGIKRVYEKLKQGDHS